MQKRKVVNLDFDSDIEFLKENGRFFTWLTFSYMSYCRKDIMLSQSIVISVPNSRKRPKWQTPSSVL